MTSLIDLIDKSHNALVSYPTSAIQNKNALISVLNGALLDMGELHCGMCSVVKYLTVDMTWLILIPVWISNHMPNKMWGEITYLFPNFNGCGV